MDPKSFKCVACEIKCGLSKETSDDYVGNVSCFKCTTTHKMIRCQRCDRGIVVGADDESTTKCVTPTNLCTCRHCGRELVIIDEKFRCAHCISAKQLLSANKFTCNPKWAHTSTSYHIDLNSGIANNLCIDISRKHDETAKQLTECRKEISELRSMITDIYNMIKFHPLLNGPEVTQTKEHFYESKGKFELDEPNEQ